MSRLIDADKLIDSMDDRYKEKVNNVPDNLAEGFMQVDKLIKEQPTAFDVDKVVEQLHKGAYYIDIETDRRVVNLNEALEIVKDGGIDEDR